ncbi:UDP-2,4-diacetamido-2,4,6-trideoxy-beta-L-altropyranose hydrolase [Bradyrhizobium sp. CCBAU 53338]|uniref:UDP-2,4-diacetamido-2,4, 6-trideoxy-beta-L-altropyranose hydrolase n=1 Tax=Bradyrhizobium sp. CCBAU 53338 TaxID=1325111 RepID=UPI00188AA9C4|nr:UDP-2,4-diacetamido-2,4,6-trideoxy-beta-L-altropyranose hydrolase [Bradyrhizobium sp. CCBAU 53338]QOZ52009.1 UDP-2,4-diacetamido-2,4,6-trideoxy-beta-L-altropyranose hydrolase [Bradyrhizobium sp. CCBAU 53338]
MLIAFRADADPVIGGGHVVRCLTLATEMQQRGAEIIFVCATGTADAVPALARSGIALLEADKNDWNAALLGGKHAGTHIDLIVVDSYRLGEPFEHALRQHACPILVIEDAPSRPHDCDMLVDMTLNRSSHDYAGLVPAHCRVLAGASYTLLRSVFGELRAGSLARRTAVPKLSSLFISLGLTDIGGQTAVIARSLLALENIARIIVVTGPIAPSLDVIVALREASNRIEVHVDPPEIAELMASTDVAVGTPGTSSWERCCLGLPSILFVVAANQQDNARALERAGAARVVTPGPDLPQAISRILSELSLHLDELARMSRQAASVCDGNGVQRVAAAIDELALPKRAGTLTLRRAAVEDARRLWLWRNDPGTRALFGDTRAVPWDTHSAWFASRLADPTTLIFILELDGRPCGNVRFHTELTGTATVSIALARHIRGQGHGAGALVLACREAFRQGFCERIEARVKRENLASQRTFLKSGFALAVEDADYFVYQLPADASGQKASRISGQAQ